MARLLHLLLLVSFLPSASLAAFSPDFSIFLACGVTSNISLPRDSPYRTFIPDGTFLFSSHTKAVTDPNSKDPSSLYAAARVGVSAFSYRFRYPDASQNTSLVLRLHFFPFPSQSPALNSSRFTVSVLGTYRLLSSFSPPSAGVVKEFFLPYGSGNLDITFNPDAGSSAFVNAIEFFAAPPVLLWKYAATPVRTGFDEGKWETQALETLYRLNVGGPKVTKENDTLWRTWLPDDPYLTFEPASAKNSTNNKIAYDTDAGYTPEVAPDIIYKTQRTMNVTPLSAATTPGLNFNVTWTFPVDPGSMCLVRLHFCYYGMLSSVVGVGLVFSVYVTEDPATIDLDPKNYAHEQTQAFYIDYAATAPTAGANFTVSIGKATTSSSADTNAILNGLEIMKLRTPDISPPGGSHRHSIIVVVAAVLGTTVLACAALCLWFVLRRRRHISRPAPEEKGSTESPWLSYTPDGVVSVDRSSRSGEGTTAATQRMNMKLQISLAEIKAATDNFHERNVIGVGGFGNVYSGQLRDGTRVAVKRAIRASRQGFPEFQAEIVMLSLIRHRHLVSLIGYCNEQSEMILVYEYIEKGILRKHLYGSDEPPLSWKQRLEICVGAARGLHYLHTGHSDNIIHRDVKSTNILLGENFVAKVADFGLSRFGPSVGQTHVSTAVKGSFGYLDPEYYKTQQLTDKSDVYSFGVVMLEVLCARPVIDNSLEREQVNLAEWALRWQQQGELDMIIDPRIGGHANQNSLRKFAETAAKCLAEYGEDRPSMSDVLWNLEYSLQLQETHERRDAFDDSGTADTQLPADIVLPQRVPSMSSVLMDDRSMTDTGVMTSKVFSQLMAGDGR